MTETPLLCANCDVEHLLPVEVCPHCKVRRMLPQREDRVGAGASVALRTNKRELQLTAELCARLAGLSVLWPLIAAIITLARGYYAEAVVATAVGLIPAAGGVTSFFLASNFFRRELRSTSGSPALLWGAAAGLVGLVIWGAALKFLLGIRFV